MPSAEGSFSAPPQIHLFDGLLSDFDGTIVDSTDGKFGALRVFYWRLRVVNLDSNREALAQVRCIHSQTVCNLRRVNCKVPILMRANRVAEELGVDPKTILATSHGRRSIDLLQLYDPSKANWECKSPSTSHRRTCTLGGIAICHVSV